MFKLKKDKKAYFTIKFSIMESGRFYHIAYFVRCFTCVFMLILG